MTLFTDLEEGVAKKEGIDFQGVTELEYPGVSVAGFQQRPEASKQGRPGPPAWRARAA